MADDKMDKDLERQYRKNLMVVASIVLIYSIAGGQMSTDLSMFGANLKFSRPDWLEWAMVAVMCFFWWRHRQMSRDIRQQHRKLVYREATVPNAVLSEIQEYGKDDFDAFHNCENGLEMNIEHGTFGDAKHQYSQTFYARDEINMRRYVWVKTSDDFSGVVTTRELKLSLNVSTKLHMVIIRSYINVAWREPHFGDSILPSITTLAAVLAYCIQKLA